MAFEDTYYALQIYGNDKWDIAIFKRTPDAEKGSAQYVESTPRLSWMKDKPFGDVWAYLVEQKKLGKLMFSMTEENKTLKTDLFPPRNRVLPSDQRLSERGPSRLG
jgi:hypothetical protein